MKSHGPLPLPAQPLVGILIPCFNQGAFARKCVESLYAQDYPHWRVVLVDDASTDGVSGGLCDALQAERVAVIHLPTNAGRSLVRNVGAKALGQVDCVLSLDCDDFLTADYISRTVARLQQDSNVGVVYGTLEYFGSGYGEAEPRKTWPTKQWQRATMYLENNIPGPGALFRQQALADTAGWRAEFTACSGEDYDIWLQVVEAGWWPAWERNAIYKYRQHAASFLAQSTERTRLAHDLAILSVHSAQIRRAGASAGYLRTKIAPAFFSAMRAGDRATAWAIMRVCWLKAPVVFSSIVLAHYGQRLLARLNWHRSS